MKNSTTMMTDSNAQKRQTFGKMLQSEQDEYSYRRNSTSDMFPPRPSDTFSPHNSAVYDQSPSRFSIPTPSGELTAYPLSKSPWSSYVPPDSCCYTGLVGSLIREEGHIYSLAASGDLLYTGSESKTIRVWKNQKKFSGFKSNSGLVKAIVISGEKIFSGHQDGKIRVWKVTGKNQSVHKRIGTMPTVKATITKSLNPSNYVEVRRNRNAIWIKHVDAISSLSLSEDRSLLYSASWDKTIKVWRISDSKCLESIHAHDDTVNSIVSGFDGLIFTGSADGSVKVWRREMQGKGMKHFFSQTLLKQECAVTSLAVDPSGNVLYCGSSDGMINFWEREKFLSHGGVLRGHKLGVLCLATVENLVLSGSADTNICIWKRESKGEHVYLSVLSGHSGPVKCLAVEEEEEGAYYCGGDKQYIIYSGSLDKSVKIWRVSGTGPVATQTPPLSGPPSQIPLPSQNVSSQVGGAVTRRPRY